MSSGRMNIFACSAACSAMACASLSCAIAQRSFPSRSLKSNLQHSGVLHVLLHCHEPMIRGSACRLFDLA